jgi:quinol monooxygenase YgiN
VNTQLHRPYRRAWHDALPTLLKGDRNITIWEPVRADHKRH